jgi:hypothetical protein
MHPQMRSGDRVPSGGLVVALLSIRAARTRHLHAARAEEVVARFVLRSRNRANKHKLHIGEAHSRPSLGGASKSLQGT